MITFDKIRELERAERTDKKMQKLPPDFITELKEYLEKKKEMQGSDVDLDTVKNTITRLFEMRETKLMESALYAARTGMKVENLTENEKEVMEKIVNALKEGRKDLFSGEKKEKEEKKELEEKKEKKIVFKVAKDIPEFVGPDMHTYRLVRGEVVNLPKPLNDLLLKEGVIERVEE